MNAVAVRDQGPSVKLYDKWGHEMAARRPRASMLAGGSGVPYDAADITGDHTRAWNPVLWSPDNEINIYRDRIVSRVRDLVRNDGWASGAVSRILDNAVGGAFRPIPKPDYHALAAYTGNKAFDAKWADSFRRAVAAHYRTWANDPARWCDSERAATVPQLYRTAFRHTLVDGDALAQMLWLDKRIGMGKARFATTFLLIHPDRLSNPNNMFDMKNVRGGVELDADGAAVAYHIRKAHMGDWWSGADTVSWTRVPREDDYGRPTLVHYFDRESAGQHRGGVGVLAPVVTRLKMLAKYDSTELDAAIINAIFAAFIESPFDHSLLKDALGDEEDPIGAYQNGRAAFHSERNVTVSGVKMPTLYPGEKIDTVNATRPASNFGEFEGAVLRNVASHLGMATPTISGNWSDVNYSSARAALLEAWKTLTRRRTDFANGFPQLIYTCILEEIMEVEDVPLPKGAPSFMEARTAYSACKWMGPGRGWVDPVSEKQGAVLGMDAGLSTLEIECAENSGEDYEDILDQRQIELEAFEARGLTPPSWAAMNVPAATSAKPEKPAKAV